MDFGIAETGIARGSPPGTTTEVLRFGVPFAEIRVVSHSVPYYASNVYERLVADERINPGSTH
jgi:hypothetical protein